MITIRFETPVDSPNIPEVQSPSPVNKGDIIKNFNNRYKVEDCEFIVDSGQNPASFYQYVWLSISE